jgi:hypothetical protein
MGVAKNPSRIGEVRRDLARAYTIIRERGGAPAAVAAAPAPAPAATAVARKPRAKAPTSAKKPAAKKPAKTKKAKG